MLSPQGSFRLFGFRGIDVFVHWSWFIAAYILFTYTGGRTTGDLISFMLIYSSLFGIIVLHEFGHALACRSVGGEAKHIVLWPLGGVAFVNPPARPGAVLWSIAAGPLVNLVLVPVFFGLYLFSGGFPEWLQNYLLIMGSINTALLVFNMLPIYPLDGGQILQSILWFFMGRAKSLRVTASIGLIIGGFAFLAALLGVSTSIPGLQLISPIMLLLLSAFVVWQAWNGFRVARYMALQEAHEKNGLEKALQRAREMAAGQGRDSH
ncbi:MAG: M50 family metallopeptidase [Planctomycetota bacterium]